MLMNFSFKTVLPLFIVFIILTAVILTAKIFYTGKDINYTMVMAGNCLFPGEPVGFQDAIPRYVQQQPQCFYSVCDGRDAH